MGSHVDEHAIAKMSVPFPHTAHYSLQHACTCYDYALTNIHDSILRLIQRGRCMFENIEISP